MFWDAPAATDEAASVEAPVEPAAETRVVAEVPKRYLFEAAGRSGYTSTPIAGGVNPFGAGFGARAGFNLWGFYLGGSVVDYLGGSDNGATDQALLVGLELGYSVRVLPYLTLRPLVGVGDTILTHSEPSSSAPVDVVTSASGGGGSGGSGGGSVTTTVKNIYVQPEVQALVAYRAFFGAFGFGVLIVPGILYGPAPAQTTTWLPYSFDFQLGFRL
jgi:hypothetical protein